MLHAESHSVVPLGIFNVLNLTRFDVQTITIKSTKAFGQYSGLVTNPRVMQFALRYDL
jgi:hypothetical protein